MKNAIFALFAICLTWFWFNLTNAQEDKKRKPSPLSPMLDIKPVPFTWALETPESSPKGSNEVLHIRYEDGRTHMFDARAISALHYYPKKYTSKLGYGHPYLYIVCGGRERRIDLAEDRDSEEFTRMALQVLSVSNMSPNFQIDEE